VPPGGGTSAGPGQLLISEFRLRGPSGAQDEFIEIYNNSGAAHTVSASSGTGYGIVASDGTARCVIPNGTIIPDRGHYLCTNSAAYSLSGNAAGDATYTTDIPDNVGIALFNSSTTFSAATRVDSAGSTSEANALYKEGTGYPALAPGSDIDYAFVRDNCGKGGSIITMGNCPSGGSLVDTDNNATDFYFVDTNGFSASAGQRLGAPGPENLASPIQRNSVFPATLVFPCVGSSASPNRIRDLTSDPANNSTFGTLLIRRTFTNNTGVPVTRLRFRVIDITTFPAPSGFADLRPRTSTLSAAVANPCGGPAVNIEGTTLETPPSQPNGGGFNSSLSVTSVTTAPIPTGTKPRAIMVKVPASVKEGSFDLMAPLPAGSSINVQFLLGIQQTGTFKFYINVEALP
jgi:hypothetical protein